MSFPALLEQILLCTPWHLHFRTWDFIINPRSCSRVTGGQAIFKEITGRGCTASDSRPTGKAGRLFPMVGWGWWDRRVNKYFPIQFRVLRFRSTNQPQGFLSQLHPWRTWMTFEQCSQSLGEIREKQILQRRRCLPCPEQSMLVVYKQNSVTAKSSLSVKEYVHVKAVS